MTVLEKSAAGGVDTDSIEIVERLWSPVGAVSGPTPLAGLAAVVICVGAVVGANGLGLMGTDKLSRTRSLRSERSRSLRTWRAGTRRGLPRSTSRAPREWWSSTPVSTRRGSTGSTGSGTQDMVAFKREWEGEADW